MKFLTKRVEKMQIFIKTTFLIRTIKEIVLLSFQAYKHDHSLHARKNSFSSKTLQKLLETKLSKGDVFVFFLFNKAYKSILMKKQTQKL